MPEKQEGEINKKSSPLFTIGQAIKQLEKKTGRKIKLVPYYSEKRHKWTVKAVYED